MGNFYTDNEDIRFYLERGIDWEPLVRAIEDDFNDPDGFQNLDEALGFYKDMFEMFGQFVADEMAPHAKSIEHDGLVCEDGGVKQSERFDQIFEQMGQLGLFGLTLPRELGGMNAPLLTYMLSSEIVSRADVSFAAHYGFHGGIAAALLVYSIEEETTEIDPETGKILNTRFQDAIEEIIAGNAFGSMDITEPDAGSDMGALRTVARQDEDGNWFVTGQKIFITSGHGKYHVVICKTEKDGDDDYGLDKLSTFMVKAYDDNPDGTITRYAHVDRIEEKLGHHASATCSVLFEDTPAHLIGERGDGFKHMLLLMNNARIGVGFEGIGISEAAYRLAKDYAAERVAFGKTIDRHEMIAEYLSNMQNDIQAMRALAVESAYNEEMSFRTKMAMKRRPEVPMPNMEREHRKSKARSRRLTPLLKFLTAEKAVEMSRMCIQIHGGVGYTTEYGAEKLLRDALVLPVYEGTTQIQALMAMKDTLGAIFKNPQKFVRKLAQSRWRAVSARDPREKLLAKIQATSMAAQQELLKKTAVDKFRDIRKEPVTAWMNALKTDWDPKRDFAWAMLHAERLTHILTVEAIAEILYEQGLEHPDRMAIFDKYVARNEPRTRYLLEMIQTSGEDLIRDLHPELDEAAAAAE